MQQIEENDTHILILEGDIQGTQVEELNQALIQMKEKNSVRVA